MYVLVKFLFWTAIWPIIWERNCPFGFLLVEFWLWCRRFKSIFLSLWCLEQKVLGNCFDSWSLPSFLFKYLRHKKLPKRKKNCMVNSKTEQANIIWAASSEKVHSSMHKMCGFQSSCTCAKFHPDLCSPLIHSNDSGSRQQRPWSDCMNVQSDLGLCCPFMPWRHIFAWRGSSMLISILTHSSSKFLWAFITMKSAFLFLQDWNRKLCLKLMIKSKLYWIFRVICVSKQVFLFLCSGLSLELFWQNNSEFFL